MELWKDENDLTHISICHTGCWTEFGFFEMALWHPYLWPIFKKLDLFWPQDMSISLFGHFFDFRPIFSSKSTSFIFFCIFARFVPPFAAFLHYLETIWRNQFRSLQIKRKPLDCLKCSLKGFEKCKSKCKRILVQYSIPLFCCEMRKSWHKRNWLKLTQKLIENWTFDLKSKLTCLAVKISPTFQKLTKN